MDSMQELILIKRFRNQVYIFCFWSSFCSGGRYQCVIPFSFPFFLPVPVLDFYPVNRRPLPPDI